jgi:hypothetical protein
MDKDKGQLIHFPGCEHTPNEDLHSTIDLRGIHPDVVHNVIHLGNWRFTCTNCSTISVFKSEQMIFRNIEFYCGKCGRLHRVSNPAFSDSPTTSKNK